MSPVVYVVTGANRGIGLAMIEELATKPNTIVYAGVRSFPPAGDSQLGLLAAKHPKTVIPIEITSGGRDNQAAAEAIKGSVGKVDVLIAMAGISPPNSTVLNVTAENMRASFETNTIGPVILYQAFSPLLIAANTASPGSAKFAIISTKAGQITETLPFPAAAYGTSKAAVNFIAKKIDTEVPEIITFPIHPGLVDTDMARAVIGAMGLTVQDMNGITPQQSAKGVLAVIDVATKETHGGKFWDENGAQLTY